MNHVRTLLRLSSMDSEAVLQLLSESHRRRMIFTRRDPSAPNKQGRILTHKLTRSIVTTTHFYGRIVATKYLGVASPIYTIGERKDKHIQERSPCR